MKLSSSLFKTEIKELKDALEKIALSKDHKEAVSLAGKALNWPESARKSLESLQKEIDRIKDLPKEPLRYGGWHLCNYCRKVIINGQVCDCKKNFWKDLQLPYKPQPIWCNASGTLPSITDQGPNNQYGGIDPLKFYF